MDKNRIKEIIKTEQFKLISIAVAACVLVVVVGVLIAFMAPVPIVNDNTGGDTHTSGQTVTFIMPVDNGTLIKNYSATALMYNSTLKQWEAHKAVDIGAPQGTPVVAVYDGTVTKVESTSQLGTAVTIDHGNGLSTVYASLDPTVEVAVGDVVKQGDVLGTVANTSKNEAGEGPHLHFEVWKDGVKIDPNLYLTFDGK